MKTELASTYIRNAIQILMDAYACANMHRSSRNCEYAVTALAHFDNIERQVRSARADLEQSIALGESNE